ncbi:AraC family transcriptional regulator [Cohnella lubricantis]|uniref:AraC family transcriptional regulator n=1 Tax=Cohnella lubricantis TaxID=2163172 RepID=A0A841TBI2_9BACL|nr:AraC family transcriptional regulator [Cohnella lubricantis]MBB6676377.1 AraC family transcriptional regulator [Cohnella lubricantis]MBP2117616.1 AraC-like DNA-binding protein/quercetin dioxygenase-like cupin family protein [Cohnella lubricantis]
MDLRHLREDRSHGTKHFPVGVYFMERQSGQPLLENHWHQEAEFLLVEEGQALFRIGSEEIELHAGEAVFVPGGELHGAYELGGSECSYKAIVFDADWLVDARDAIAASFLQPLRRGRIALQMPFSPKTKGGAMVLDRLGRLYGMESVADPAREARFKGELILLFADIWSSGEWSERQADMPADTRTVERLKETLAYIETRFSQKLTVGELAVVAGMSEGHFSRTFKSYMRKTPIDYINHLRLRHAALRLAESGMNVGEAAIEAGFDNFSYFSKMFRTLFQCSPSEYRRQARNIAQAKTPSSPDGGKAFVSIAAMD